MFKKIAITLILLTLAVGVVSAVDMESMKVPDGFEKFSSNCFQKGKFELSIAPYSDSDKDLVFEDEDNYTISEYSSNIYTYVDKFVKHSGAVEVVEINGEKYLVECLKEDSTSDEISAYTYLSEFNSLNDLTPIEP